MSKRIFRAGLAVALIALGVCAWRIFFPSAEQVIRKRLNEVARTASFSAKEAPLATALNSQKLANFFAPEVEIRVDVPGRWQHTFHGRDEIAQAAASARSLVGGLSVEFLDITVTIAPDRESAEASLTLKARIAGEKDLIVQELKFFLKRIDGTWLIIRVETVKTLS